MSRFVYLRERAIRILCLQVRDDLLLKMIGEATENADAVFVVTVFELKAVVLADRIKDRREGFLHVLRAALIDLRCGDRDEHVEQDSTETVEKA